MCIYSHEDLERKEYGVFGREEKRQRSSIIKHKLSIVREWAKEKSEKKGKQISLLVVVGNGYYSWFLVLYLYGLLLILLVMIKSNVHVCWLAYQILILVINIINL